MIMPDIALGLKDQDLIAFASAVNAAEMSRWRELGLYDEDVEGWGHAFQQAVERTLSAGGKIHFNLTGLDIAEALAGDPGCWVGRYTAWELQQIVGNGQWFQNA